MITSLCSPPWKELSTVPESTVATVLPHWSSTGRFSPPRGVVPTPWLCGGLHGAQPSIPPSPCRTELGGCGLPFHTGQQKPQIVEEGRGSRTFWHDLRTLATPLARSSRVHLLFQIAERMAKAQVPEAVINFIRMGRLTALSKPDGGVRGIVVGDVLRRLVARTMSQQLEVH